MLDISESKNLILDKDKSYLNDYELLKVVLPDCYKKLPASFFVNKQGLNELKNKSCAGLISKFNIDKKTAVKLIAITELGSRIYKTDIFENKKFTNYNDLYKMLAPEFIGKEVEEFWAVFLSINGTIIHIDKVSTGNFLTTVVNPNQVFRQAILLNAKAIVLVHNHPSGKVKPSYSDYDLTTSMLKAGRLLDIKVLEHIIIGKDCFYQIIKDKKVSCSLV